MHEFEPCQRCNRCISVRVASAQFVWSLNWFTPLLCVLIAAPRMPVACVGSCSPAQVLLTTRAPRPRPFTCSLVQVAKKGKIASILFNMAFQARKAALKMSTDTPFWRWLMFDKIRTGALGGRLRLMLSGGGSLEPATEEFFTTVFCCPLAQGYGLTETCAAGTINWADDVSHGRVGPPVLCADIKLVDWVDGGYLHTDENPRGEIYIGGPSVTAGYYKQPEKTRESFFTDEDGFRWFASGDIGELMPGGVLRIIDRRKDLFKLSHGEYIAPSKIEGALLSSHYIEHVMIYADPTKDYCIAIAVPKAATLTRDFPELAQGGHARKSRH